MQSHDQSKTWKFFEQNELTHSAAHYLMTIHDLKKKDGYARLSDIAAHMDITPGSCKITLSKLVEKGLIQDDEKKFYHLTDLGQELFDQVVKNEALFEHFFHEILGVDKWQAEIDACKIEHLISPETSDALCQFLRYVENKGLITESFKKGFEQFCNKDKECITCKTCDLDCLSKGKITPDPKSQKKSESK